MPCLNCGTERTIRAHLIPQAFVQEVRGDESDHAFVLGDGSFVPNKNGRFDPNILCQPCDGQLGQFENYAIKTLKRIRVAAPKAVNRMIGIEGIDGDQLIRFAAGIAWKYTATQRHLGRIDIGPYAETVRQVAFSTAEIPACIDALLVKIHSGDADSYIYRAALPYRYEGRNFVRFAVGGFVILLKIDRRSNPTGEPSESWLRGRRSIVVRAMAMNTIDEGRTVLNERRDNPQLDSFLKRVGARTGKV